MQSISLYINIWINVVFAKLKILLVGNLDYIHNSKECNLLVNNTQNIVTFKQRDKLFGYAM
jgi:hypothetical protein